MVALRDVDEEIAAEVAVVVEKIRSALEPKPAS